MMIDFGYVIGWVGVAFGFCVPLPQIYKIIKTGKTRDISLVTYTFLCIAMACYLIHAIHIQAVVFIVAHSINLTTNTVILVLMIRNKENNCG